MNVLESDWDKAIRMSRCFKEPNGMPQDNEDDRGWITPAAVATSKKKKPIPDKTSISLETRAFTQCYSFRNREKRQNYPPQKFQTDNSSKLYEAFRKLIASLQMLGTVVTIWKVFNRAWDNLRDTIVDIEFVPAFPEFIMEKPDLRNTIESWSGLEKSGSRSEVMKMLGMGETKPFTRYYHCELQLLRHREAIGGSKKNDLFRGDIWVFKCDAASPLYWQNIAEKSADDLDYQDFLNLRTPAEDEDDDTRIRREDAAFWAERRRMIEQHLVELLRDEFDRDRAESARNSVLKVRDGRVYMQQDLTHELVYEGPRSRDRSW
ncbi:hypothetical protein EJ04DRAFT_523022 [Polyplosphaeria fusca]|uniref:Uncharacterized protein n=1 Tax=Polyplosphaeria fusca TaxID=682080 RepID=A0A9P4R1X8_9PLEO|nr:hypothetical protein EJ04DRAFT_523022 [Polyplosphaeria fusca]